MKELLTLLLMVIHFQVILPSNEVSHNSIQKNKDVFNWAPPIIRDYTKQQKFPSPANMFKPIEKKNSRNKRSEQPFSLESQFERICRKKGSQPCTCLYPDHPNTTQFELGTDEITVKASGVNGSGPASCQDLIDIGYKLNGFYMVRLNTQRAQTVFCNFTNQSKMEIIDPTLKESPEAMLVLPSQGKRLKYCGGFSNISCKFFFSDYPDAPKFKLRSQAEKKTNGSNNIHGEIGPRNCEDLKVDGHTLKSFYVVRLDSKRMKVIYCDFNGTNQTEKDTSHPSANICKGFGSQPCSCFLEKNGNISQLEIGTDYATQKVLAMNGLGPSNCKDLQQLGHILKGFYLVRLNGKLMKTIYCEFTLQISIPNYTTEANDFKISTFKITDKDQLDFNVTKGSITTTKKNDIPMKEGLPKQDRRPNERDKDIVINTSTSIPITETPWSSNISKGTKNINTIPVNYERFDLATTTTTRKPDQFGVYIYTANTTHGLKKYKKIPLTEASGESFYLINNHGKCLEQDKNQTYSRAGTKLIQRICNTYYVYDNGRNWSMKKADKYSGIRLLFSFGACVSLGGYLKGPSDYAEIFDDDDGGCDNQKWEVSVLKNGIQFSSGNNCLAIEGDSTESGSFAISAVCDVKQKGQIWSFVLFEK